jgi:dTDP-4-dehydrorhamnose reductase
VTNSGHTTWYGFAVEIGRYLGATAIIRPTTTDRFPRPATRPKYSILSGARYLALTGETLPPWEEAVHHYLASRKAVAGEAA